MAAFATPGAANPPAIAALEARGRMAGLEQRGDRMGDLFILILLGCGAWWLYKAGKRAGSRKGYNVGRSRSRRRK